MPRFPNGIPVRILPRYRAMFSESVDPDVYSYLRHRVRSGDTCVNVGANIGLYALQLAHMVGAEGKIIAFEPNPNSIEVLKWHCRASGVAERVLCHPWAVSDRVESRPFFFSETSVRSRLDVPNERIQSSCEETMVRVVSLDHYFSERDLSSFSWGVIDVEGWEAAVLRGARQTIRRLGPNVSFVVEFHPNAWHAAGETPRSVKALLEELGLRVTALTGQRDVFEDYGQVALEPR